MNELEHLNVELSGTNLIEASAGTGKTYAIACLYLRLLVEKGLGPDRILVVTFTEAATEELRGRIRGRIREALEVFSGKSTEDPFLLGLSSNVNGRGPGRDVSLGLLNRALTSFDMASIFTIHAFCLRALQDNAFESGSLYGVELSTEPSGMFQAAVDDFWRMKFFGHEAPLLKSVLSRGCTPESLAEFAFKMLESPKTRILPDFSSRDEASIHRDCLDAFAELGREWREHGEEVVCLLENDKGLSRAEGTYRQDLLPALFERMAIFVRSGNPYDLFEGFERFTSTAIINGTKSRYAPPLRPFFDKCQRLMKLVDERFLFLKWELLQFCRDRLPTRKRKANVRFFSDLLNDLYAALRGDGGDTLAERLRDRYNAALIDEFQDTDPVQYDIFHRIYDRPENPLFLIGDPKQAIYSFRGADIFAYMEAARSIADGSRFTLTNNWRSTPGLLSAFNMLFGNGRNPFVYEDIAYHPIFSGRSDAGNPLVLQGMDGAPLQIWTIPSDDDGNQPGVGKANDAIKDAVAAEISSLLRGGVEGRARLEECDNGRRRTRPVIPGDVAVIVRSHRQAGHVQAALRKLGIPSVMRSDETIFATDEAREIHAILSGIAEPAREYKVRTALATRLMGLSGNHLADLLEDEKAWEEWLERFRWYHRLWLDRGFMVMSRDLLAGEGIRGRLLRRPDGERRLTNVLHCFEVIHQMAHGELLGMERLLKRLGEKVAIKEKSDEYQIRLETDEQAVKIVTVHVSKGLEYPIVFCPFLWAGIKTEADVAVFHDGFIMVRDFGSEGIDRHRVLGEKETLAESLRLLYVALTRAKYRCYLVAGKVNGKTVKNRPETSPISYLLHAPEEVRTREDLVAAMEEEIGKLTAPQMEEQLREIAGNTENAISVAPMPVVVDTPSYVPSMGEMTPLKSRTPQSAIERDWRVASFTSFTKGDERMAELPDRDETSVAAMPLQSVADEEESRGMSIFTFPKGARAGIFLHALFEKMDFPDECGAHGDLVSRCLKTYGYSPEWQPYISEMVTNVLTTPITGISGHFTLSGLRKGRWVTELEFFFPLRFITSDSLKKRLRKWSVHVDAVDLGRVCSLLGFRPVRGVVRGFMDMVFEHEGRYYLLDWKSNHMGYRHEDYRRDRLGLEMEKHLYPLQYLFYTVALDRYLSMRVRDYSYESHFGGALYVFLRGVTPDNKGETGIFKDIPPAEMVRELAELLIEADVQGGRNDL